jgi:hypothetical protein
MTAINRRNAAGKVAAWVPVGSGDETGELARAFKLYRRLKPPLTFFLIFGPKPNPAPAFTGCASGLDIILEALSQPRITPEGKAQADLKALHTWKDVSISRGWQRGHRASDEVMEFFQGGVS